MRATVPLRLARAAAFAAVCVLLAVGAHLFAGGAGPKPAVVLAGGLVVAGGAAAWAGRERSPAAVVGLVLAAQVFLHRLFAATAGSPAALPPPPGGPYDHALGVRTGMLIAHLTAALITGWWLSRGETALWSVLHGIGRGAIRWLAALLAWFALLRGVVRTVPRPRGVPAAPAGTPRVETPLRHTVIRRGPPVLLLG